MNKTSQSKANMQKKLVSLGKQIQRRWFQFKNDKQKLQFQGKNSRIGHLQQMMDKTIQYSREIKRIQRSGQKIFIPSKVQSTIILILKTIWINKEFLNNLKHSTIIQLFLLFKLPQDMIPRSNWERQFLKKTKQHIGGIVGGIQYRWQEYKDKKYQPPTSNKQSRNNYIVNTAYNSIINRYSLYNPQSEYENNEIDPYEYRPFE